MSVTVPAGLRHAVVDEEGGPEWLDSIPALAARAVERWSLVLGEPFESGMAGWTAPATTAAGTEVVVKLSYPHVEARDEAAALGAWHGAGAVEVLDADADDWALLLRRLRPGTSLRDERLPPGEHLAVGAELLRRMASVPIPAGEPFRNLVEVARPAGGGRRRAGRAGAARSTDSGRRRTVSPRRRPAEDPARRRRAPRARTRRPQPRQHPPPRRQRPARRMGPPGGGRSTRSRCTATWRGTRGRC